MAFPHRTHKHGKGQCDRCGFVFKLRQLWYEWSGLKVCGKCWDPFPTLDYPRPIVAESNALDDPRPRNNTYAEIGHAIGTYGIIGRGWLGADLRLEAGEVTRA